MKKLLCLILIFMFLLSACNSGVTGGGTSSIEPDVSDTPSVSDDSSDTPTLEDAYNISGNIEFSKDEDSVNYDLNIDVEKDTGIYGGTLGVITPETAEYAESTLPIEIYGDKNGKYYSIEQYKYDYEESKYITFREDTILVEDISHSAIYDIIFNVFEEYNKILSDEQTDSFAKNFDLLALAVEYNEAANGIGGDGKVDVYNIEIPFKHTIADGVHSITANTLVTAGETKNIVCNITLTPTEGGCELVAEINEPNILKKDIYIDLKVTEKSEFVWKAPTDYVTKLDETFFDDLKKHYPKVHTEYTQKFYYPRPGSQLSLYDDNAQIEYNFHFETETAGIGYLEFKYTVLEYGDGEALIELNGGQRYSIEYTLPNGVDPDNDEFIIIANGVEIQARMEYEYRDKILGLTLSAPTLDISINGLSKGQISGDVLGMEFEWVREGNTFTVTHLDGTVEEKVILRNQDDQGYYVSGYHFE